VRSLKAMTCDHDGFHGIGSRYDQTLGVLVYFWTCESCGRSLGEAHREEYRPQFDPSGSGARSQPVRESTQGLPQAPSQLSRGELREAALEGVRWTT
jgi:hypothetical protein